MSKFNIKLQDTGLKDQHGKNLFIGDVVEHIKSEYLPYEKSVIKKITEAVVVYEHGKARLKIGRLDCYGGAYYIIPKIYSDGRIQDVSKKGNIWEIEREIQRLFEEDSKTNGIYSGI